MSVLSGEDQSLHENNYRHSKQDPISAQERAHNKHVIQVQGFGLQQ